MKYNYQRSRNHIKHQRELLRARSKGMGINFGWVGTLLAVIFLSIIQGVLASLFEYLVSIAAKTTHPYTEPLLSNVPLSSMLGSLFILWWILTMCLQGEGGLHIDFQRRRHPMWEWLFSHPINPKAVFAAEMMGPLAANPVYLSIPTFWGVLYGLYHDFWIGILAFFAVGIPFSLTCTAITKALEIGILLKFSIRSRGAILGLLSCLGQLSLYLGFLGVIVLPDLKFSFPTFLSTIADYASWPIAKILIGVYSNEAFAPYVGIVACWLVCAVLLTIAVLFAVWGAKQGLAGNSTAQKVVTAISWHTPNLILGKEPLYKKELLWFLRDRSAVVQAIILPLSISAMQLFNMRKLLLEVTVAWQYLSGLAVIFGTYFLWVLGPRSLASEGPALCLTLTWPKGLEALLKAKAWLWSIRASALVGFILLLTMIRFPEDSRKISLVGLGWIFFARSMAEKSVTLVAVQSSSGEPEIIPAGRKWAASLGLMTFGLGILTRQWHLAIVGVVYSWLTATAMWQNFRFRLPYLYDRWSEELPPAPPVSWIPVGLLGVVNALFLKRCGSLGPAILLHVT